MKPFAFLAATMVLPLAISMVLPSAAQNADQTEGAVPETSDTVPSAGGDPAAGEMIASEGRNCGKDDSASCSACFTCHGEKGLGSAHPKGGVDIPRLAGQAYGYLYSTLKAFAEGKRDSDVMQQVASQLDEQGMRDVAAYYSSVSPNVTDITLSHPPQTDIPYDRMTMGGALAAVGDMHRGIQACSNCHGPRGSGLGPTYPMLGGQYAQYLKDQLNAFKTGKRTDDPYGIMTRLAARMTPEEIDAVAEYYAALRPVAAPGAKQVPEEGAPQ